MVAKTSNDEILRRMRGHTDTVYCLAFAAGSKNIVSGPADSKIMTWEWESSEPAVQVLEGHERGLSRIAVSSDGERIFSCSSLDGTLRVWDATTGTQAEELSQGSRASRFALSGNGQMIAVEGIVDVKSD